MARFGERLRHLRTEHELSQMELAKNLKTSKSSVNMYERCEREPSLEMLERIADFFNVDLDYLLGKSDCPNKYALPNPSHSFNVNPATLSHNIIRIAGRDGSYREEVISDEQMAKFMRMLDELPDASDDL